MSDQADRVAASKAAGRAENIQNAPHSAVGGRNDAVWEAVASGASGATPTLSRSRSSVGAKQKNLSDDLDKQQLVTFTRWWNSWLSEANIKVTDLCAEIKPGIVPIRLLEVLSDSSCGKYNKKAVGKFMQLENHNIFLNTLKAKSIKLVNIGAEDLWAGDRKLVLGLTWTLILRYEIHQFGGNENELLDWTKELGDKYGVNVEAGGWGQAFNDGQLFCAMVHEAEPEVIDLEETNKMSSEKALETAFHAAEEHLGVPQLLEASDFESTPIDSKSVILYVAKLKQACDEHVGVREAAEAEHAEAAAKAAGEEEANRAAAQAAEKAAAEKAAKEAAEAADKAANEAAAADAAAAKKKAEEEAVAAAEAAEAAEAAKAAEAEAKDKAEKDAADKAEETARLAALAAEKQALLDKRAELEDVASKLKEDIEATPGRNFKPDLSDVSDTAEVIGLLNALHDDFRGKTKPELQARKEALEKLRAEVEGMQKAYVAKARAMPTPKLVRKLTSKDGMGDEAGGGEIGVTSLSSRRESKGPGWLGNALSGLFSRSKSTLDVDGSGGRRKSKSAPSGGDDDGVLALHEGSSPAAVDAAWTDMEGAEFKYEAALEAKLNSLEADKRSAETEALVAPLRNDGASVLSWAGRKTHEMDAAAMPEALHAMSADEVAKALAALDAKDRVDEVVGKEASKNAVQAGLRDVAAKAAAHAPGEVDVSTDPMIGELDTAWAKMQAAEAELRKGLRSHAEHLDAAKKREATDAEKAAAAAKAAALLAALAAAKQSFADKEKLLGLAKEGSEGGALSGDEAAAVEAAIKELQGPMAAQRAKWAAESSAVQEAMRGVEDGCAAEGREPGWKEGEEPAAVSAALADLNAAAIAHEEALLASLGAARAAQEAERLQKDKDLTEALNSLESAIPAMTKRASLVAAADKDAASGAATAQDDLLPWVQGERGRIDDRLKKLRDPLATGSIEGGDGTVFVINGFYMAMREKYTKPGEKIYYYLVEWDPAKLSWEDFRGKVLGATDPATAADGSLRKTIFKDWKALCLAAEPDVGDNGVHASASPFEALAERLNWMGATLEDDAFGKAMLASGIPKETIMAWTKDPQVPFNGSKASLFDMLEDLSAPECLLKAQKIAGVSDVPVAPVTTQQAFVFLKPHAVTEPAQKLVASSFSAAGISITKEGTLGAAKIEGDKLIDNHYYAIANKASLTKPKDLNPPQPKQDEFEKKFGISWKAALRKGIVYNAVDGCKRLGIDGAKMDDTWGKAKKAGDLVKFGGGFYAGRLAAPEVGPMRKRSTVDAMNPAAIAAEINKLREFREGTMPEKKQKLHQLRADINTAVATRQLQRFEGERPSNMPRINELLPQPPHPKYRLAIIEFLVPGANNGGSDKGPNGHRIDSIPIANGVIKTGNGCEILRYDASKHGDFASSLGPYDAFIVRINPGQLSQGTPAGTQERFDVLMNEQLKAGKLVWSTPDVQTKMGAKDALVKIADMNCGLPDTLAYYTRQELEEGFKKTCAFQPRVIKQNRGSAGEGIWLCWLQGKEYCKAFGDATLKDDDKLKLMEMNDNHVEYKTVKEFLAFCVDGPGGAAGEWKSTFPGKYLEGGKEAGGQLVDQRLLPRIEEGEVRVLMVSDATQMIIHKKPQGGGLSAVGGNSDYTYYLPGCEEYKSLEERLHRDLPQLLDKLDLKGEPLPLLWTADFIPKDAEDGTPGVTEYVVGEFNCSCVGVSKFQAVCGGEKTLADVSDEDYFEACKLTDLMGIKAIAKLDSRTPFAIKPAAGAAASSSRRGSTSPAGLVKHIFLYDGLRPDDESGTALAKGLLDGASFKKGSVSPAQMFEEESKLVSKPAVVLLSDKDVAKQSGVAPRVVGYALTCDDPTAFMKKLKQVDEIEGYKPQGGGAYQRDVRTITLESGETVEAYVYHKPKALRSKRVWSGDWARRKENFGGEAGRLEEEEAMAARAAETRAGACALLKGVLENKAGEKVDPATALAGKVVGLYFSAHWCPPCRKFTPMLHTLYDEVNEDGKKLEIIFVSSDKSAEEQGEYMQAMHGDWLRVNFGSDVRGKLKARYGVFAGSEAADFPNVTRRCGIPGLVLFGPNFEELGQYDCDDGGNGLKLITAKGGATIDGWKPLAWPATVPAGGSARAGGASGAAGVTALPTGLEAEVLTLHKLEAEWSGLEKDAEAYNQALLDKLSSKRGPELEFARLRRGCARLSSWLAENNGTLTSTALPGKGGAGGGDDGDKGGHCDPECDVLTMLYDAQRVEVDLELKQAEAAQLAALVERLKGEPEYAKRAMELFASVGPAVHDAVPHMHARVAELEKHKAELARRRAERLAYDAKVAQFEATVDRAIELTAFPVPSVDTAEQLSHLLAEGNAQAEGLERPAPEGASDEAKGEAADLLLTWREIVPAINLRTAECESDSRASVEQAQLLAECAALNLAYRGWERRTNKLLTPDSSLKSVDSDHARARAELASAQIPTGEALLSRQRKLRAQLRSYDEGHSSKSDSLSAQASLPPDAEMVSTIEHVREMANRLSLAAAASPEPHDRAAVERAMQQLEKHDSNDERLQRFGADPFPLDEAPASEPPPAHEMTEEEASELSLSVIQRVNRIRTQPKMAAAEMRQRMKSAYDGNTFSPPWLRGGKPIVTKEGITALDDLCKRLEKMPPLNPLEHLPALQIAAYKLGDELASGKDRKHTSAIEDRLRSVGTWSGVAGEAVMYGMRLPEAIVAMMMLCDGDLARKNRAFVLNPDVKFACFASTEMALKNTAGGRVVGPIGVLSLLSHFYPVLKEEITVEFQGPVEKRRRPMPEDMARVLRALPSDEACDIALAALSKGKHLKLEYKINSVTITVTDRKGVATVSRLKWK